MDVRSERISLREVGWDDLELIHRLNSCPETDQFNTLGIPEDMEVTREVIREPIEDRENSPRRHYCWVIRDKEEFIGEIGLKLRPEKFSCGEMFYSVLPEHYNKGYATEAVGMVVDFCFDRLKLHRIEAGVACKNVASIRVLEKIGLTLEGIGRQILPIRGEWVDNYRFAILYTD